MQTWKREGNGWVCYEANWLGELTKQYGSPPFSVLECARNHGVDTVEKHKYGECFPVGGSRDRDTVVVERTRTVEVPRYIETVREVPRYIRTTPAEDVGTAALVGAGVGTLLGLVVGGISRRAETKAVKALPAKTKKRK